MSAECGTTAGYSRHLRLGEDTCQPCRDAKAAMARGRRGASARDRAAARAAHRPVPLRVFVEPVALPPPVRTLSTAQLDALCGGAPQVMVPCPRPGCRRKLGPYYSATSPDARAAMDGHLRVHATVWSSTGAVA